MKKFNKFMSMLLALITLVAVLGTNITIYADEDSNTDDSYVDNGYEDDNSGYYSPGPQIDPNPVLKMSSDGIFNFSKGETRDVTVKIKNVSSFYAYNILIQPVASGTDFPYEIQVLDNSNTKYFLQNTTTMQLKLRISIDDDAKSGIYPLTLNYAFTANDKNGFTGSDTVYIKVGGEATNTSLTLKNFQRSADEIKAGGVAALYVDIENTGNGKAEDVTVVLDGLAADGIGMANGSNTYNFSSLEKGEVQRLSFNITANRDLKSGSYPLTYKLKYLNGDGDEVTKEFGYYVNVVSAEDNKSDTRADLTVTTSEPTGTYGVGQVFSITLDVKNTGENKASNVVITAAGDEEGCVVPRSTSVRQIKSLNVGASQSFTFDFAATSKAGTKNYPISFSIEYETGADTEEGAETRKFVQYSGVNVYNPESDEEDTDSDEEKKISTPKIIISRYECNPVIVEAGKTFDIEMTFKNTHSTKSVNNVKLYLTVDEETEKQGNVFTPDQASNTFYIDKIAPKGEVSHTFSMYTVPNADARTYSLNVNFEYEDEEYNEFKTTELVGINVKQKAELTTNDIIVPAEGSVGEGVNIAFDLYNTGKVNLSNVMVRVVGDGFDTTSATYYSGTLDIGASDTYDGNIIPTDMGTASGQVIITYEDSAGEQYEKVQDFTINVSEAMPVDDFTDYDTEMPEEEEGPNIPVIIGAGVSVLVIIIIVTVLVKRKIKKRREMELSE